MSQDEFTKLFNHMTAMQEEMRAGFESMATKVDIDTIHNTLDTIVEIVERDDVERAAITNHLDQIQDVTDDHGQRIAKLERRTA